MQASLEGYAKTICLLLERGADINAQDHVSITLRT
jgi:ankyrin repeat protein